MSRTWGWWVRVIERHGIDLGDGRYQITVTQAALAETEGVSPSTIFDRLSRLRDHGIVITTSPIITLHPHHSRKALPDPGGQVLPFPGRTDLPTRSGWKAALLEANQILAQAATTPDAPIEDILNLQTAVLATIRGTSALAAGSRTAETRGFSGSDTQFSEEVDLQCSNQLTDCLPEHQDRVEPAGFDRGRAAEPADPTETDRILPLVAPLVEVAQQHGMVGITNRAGLVRALSPYTNTQIRHAVTQAVAKAKASTRTSQPMTSPVGWLIRLAEAHDPDLFPPTPTPTRREPVRVVEPQEEPIPKEQQMDRLHTLRRTLHPERP